jgi:hypothetical protein
MHEDSLRETVVLIEGVDRTLYTLSLLEQTDMLNHHIRIEGVGMVVVQLRTLLQCQLVMSLVVEVVAERSDMLLNEGLL